MAASDSIVSILKSVVHGRRPANDIKKAGQPYVNFADMQFGVIDTLGNHQDLLAITLWKAHATYAVNSMVVYSGSLYKCKTANHDTRWTSAHWSIETDLVVAWSKISGKPTTFPIDAHATALIAAAKKVGYDAGIKATANAKVIAANKASIINHVASIAQNKAAAAAALAKANAVTKLAGPRGLTGARGATGHVGASAVVRSGTAAPTGGKTGDLYIQY